MIKSPVLFTNTTSNKNIKTWDAGRRLFRRGRETLNEVSLIIAILGKCVSVILLLQVGVCVCVCVMLSWRLGYGITFAYSLHLSRYSCSWI